MIIKCEICKVAFDVGEGIQVHPEGAMVTCSSCKNRFRIYPDEMSPPPSSKFDAASESRTTIFQKKRKVNQDKLRLIGKNRLILSALLLLVLSLGFNVMLSLTSLEKLYIESLVSKYSVIGKDLQRNIEKSLRFGKPIHKFLGMDDILNETQRNLNQTIQTARQDAKIIKNSTGENDLHVSIASLAGNILYSTDQSIIRKRLPETVQKLVSKNKSKNGEAVKSQYEKHGITYYIMLPVRGGFKKERVGTVVISFSERRVKQFLDNILIQNVKWIGIILSVGFVLLVFLLEFVVRTAQKTNKFPKGKIYLILFTVIGMAQIVFSYLNTDSFKDYYLRINREKAGVMASLLKEDIEYLLDKGLHIDKLIKMDVMIGEIIAASPELDNITIMNKEGRPLYQASKKGVIDFQKKYGEKWSRLESTESAKKDSRYYIRMDIMKDKEIEGFLSAETYQGIISTNISKKVLYEKLRQIALDSATVLVISFLFFIELLILMFQWIRNQTGMESMGQIHQQYKAMRPAAFLFIVGYSVSSSFIPLHMENLYEPVFGLSKDMVIGLPISVRVLFAGIAIAFSGNWFDRRGWRQPFYCGLTLVGIGFMYSWFAPNAIHFVISCAIVGLGYGLGLMASQGYVILHADSETKSQGVSHFWAGVYAGAICGSAAGGMLAERIGFKPVFFIGAVIVFIAMLYSIFFIRDGNGKLEIPQMADQQEVRSFRQIFRFLINRNIFSVILLSSIAAEIAIMGFINYYSPLFLNRIGTSQSNIGRIFMLNGLCIIFLGPFVSRYIDASANKKHFIGIGGLLTGAAFLAFFAVLFYGGGGLMATAAAVLMLGISASFSTSARSSYILRLEVTRALGQGKAMSIFSSSGRIGQMLGPMVFGTLMVSTQPRIGMMYIGLAFVVAAMLFLLIAQKEPKHLNAMGK